MLTMWRNIPHRVQAWFHCGTPRQNPAGAVEQEKEVAPSAIPASRAGACEIDGATTDMSGGAARPGGAARSWAGMFVGTDYRIWLVEQEVTRLGGEYLTEAMVLAPTAQEALDAAHALADPVHGFGLVVQRHRLRALDYGLAPELLPAVFPRFQFRAALVLVVGTGSDQR